MSYIYNCRTPDMKGSITEPSPSLPQAPNIYHTSRTKEPGNPTSLFVTSLVIKVIIIVILASCFSKVVPPVCLSMRLQGTTVQRDGHMQVCQPRSWQNCHNDDQKVEPSDIVVLGFLMSLYRTLLSSRFLGEPPSIRMAHKSQINMHAAPP
jgi:hypothetical protein